MSIQQHLNLILYTHKSMNKLSIIPSDRKNLNDFLLLLMLFYICLLNLLKIHVSKDKTIRNTNYFQSSRTIYPAFNSLYHSLAGWGVVLRFFLFFLPFHDVCAKYQTETQQFFFAHGILLLFFKKKSVEVKII